MRFTPKTAAEVDAGDLWPNGTYDFEIVSAEEATSKAGNDMIKLRVKIFNDAGQSQTLFDYLMESVAYKLRHACEACGLLESYEAGELNAEDFEGKSGTCKINVQKDKSGQYPDKNGIADYMAQKGGVAKPARPKPAADDLDDSIPF